ncbi:hypothetical protein GQ42DRAFT_156175 [Ramicandelaber brevisporus]|nr:hypothetical protein GQ42DRAFT_156175 [Ramicandelaber brevisporus]
MKLAVFATVAAALVSAASAAQFTLYSGKVFTGDSKTFDYSVEPGFCTCVNVKKFNDKALSARWDNENNGAIGFFPDANCKGENPTWPLKFTNFPIDFSTNKLKSGISSVRVCRT